MNARHLCVEQQTLGGDGVLGLVKLLGAFESHPRLAVCNQSAYAHLNASPSAFKTLAESDGCLAPEPFDMLQPLLHGLEDF